MKRIFIIHGWEGYPEEGWRPWLRKKLENEGFEVIVPAMPDTKTPTLEVWLPFLKNLVGKPTNNDFFVGHSLGCITILRLIESLEKSEKVGGAVLIAGFGTDLKYNGYEQELSSFFNASINWAKIKTHCSKFISIQSSNDPWVSIENNELFKQMLNAKTVVVPNMKHFSGDDGIRELPIALDSVIELTK